MRKYQIVLIVTFLQITAPLILSENMRCLPPNNFLLEGQCVSECGIDYVVMQGAFKCIPRNECINKGQVSKFGEQYFPYCIQDPLQMRDDFISLNNQCSQELTKKNYITGTCMDYSTIYSLQFSKIGVYNEKGVFYDAIFSKSLIKEILSQPNINYQQELKNIFNPNCELIDSFNQSCISKNQCIEKRLNISSGDCVETCQHGLISYKYNCKRKEDIDPKLLFKSSDNTWVLKHTCFHFKQNDQCHKECPGIKWIDFSTGIKYCDYQQGDDLYTSNKVNLLQVIPEECPTPTSKGCFQFCTKDNYLISEINQGNYHLNNRFLNVCEDKHNIQFGIFLIARDDCPYYISNQQCVKQCDPNFKWIQRKNFKECIPCNSTITSLCYDHCKTNDKYAFLKFKMCLNAGTYTFHYESLDQQGRCIFPKMLSQNGNDCIDECGKNEIPQRIEGSNEFICIQNNNLEIPNIQQNFYLSSKKTRYVEKCNDINEIELSSFCIKRSEDFGQQQPCDWKIKEELEFIEGEKERLLQKFLSPEFMEENIKWYFKRIKIEVLTIEERISLLAQMTYLAMEFLQKYTEYTNYTDGFLFRNHKNGRIYIKMDVIPDKGGLFETSINFEDSFSTNTFEIKSVETILIQTLSLTYYYQGYVICTSEDSCSNTQFIIVQMIMQEESSEIKPEFEIEFEIEEVESEETDNEKKYICFDGRIGDFFSQRTYVQLNGDRENVSSITCKGNGIIGYYYGKKDDVISLKTKAEYEEIKGQKKVQENIINQDRNPLNSDRAPFEILQNEPTSDKDQQQKDLDKLGKDTDKLAKDEEKLTNDKVDHNNPKIVNSDPNEMVNSVAGTIKNDSEIATETSDKDQQQKDLNKLAKDEEKLTNDKVDHNNPKIVNSDPNEMVNSVAGTIKNDSEIAKETPKQNEDKSILSKEKNDLNKKKDSNQQQVENKSGSNLTQILIIVAVSVLGGIIIIFFIYKFVFKRSPKLPI